MACRPGRTPPIEHRYVDELPEKIGKYEVIGIAGKGAMGVVYVAHDPFFDREVAIKTAHALAGDDPRSTLARKLLYNEARAAGALDHGAILQVFDAGEHEGHPYIVMEYIPRAETLKDFSDPGHLLPIGRAVEIIHICAKALDYAHRRGVIHRDIKASNIMLTQRGEVKICDFGIAKLDREDATEVLGTMGSPRYMSPEQILDHELSPKTDIYSLGVVMYELLTGCPAFEGHSFTQLTTKILTQRPRPVTEIRAEIPKPLGDIVEKAMHKMSDQRYLSGLDLASDLAALYSQLSQPPEELSSEEKFRIARGLSFFNEFSDAELREVIRASQWQQFKAGERIIREGNMEDFFFVLARGDVALSKGGKRVGTIASGSCFGEMAHVSHIARTATIHARDDVVLIKIAPAMIDHLSFNCQLRFNQAFMHILVDRLASTTERLSKFLD